MWSGLICVKGDTFLWFKLGHKRYEGQAEALMYSKCSFVSVLLYLFFTIFMVEKADSQLYVEVCTLLLCG